MMATRLRKRIRCRYFDDNGDPTRTRCKNTVDTCDFVHPSEAEWDDLPPYHRAPRRSTFDGAPDRVRRRSRSPTLLGRMTRRSRSRSPRRYNPSHRSHSPVRKPPLSPTMPRFAPPPPRAGPSQNDPLSDQLRDTRARTDSIASSSGFNMVGNQGVSMQPTPSAVQVPRAQLAKPMQPTPGAMQQLLPLPLLPIPPTLLSVKQSPPRAEMSFDEKRKAWAERVQLLSDSLQQRTKLGKLDQEINLIKRLSSFGPTATNVTGPSRQAFEAKLAALESQREEARKNYDVILSRTIAIDSWPVAPPAENENRESLSKMIKYCEDLQRGAEEINRILSRSISIVPSSEVHKGDSSRPLKRARVEEDGAEQERQAVEMYEELRDRVLAMHGTITSIQNDQNASRNDLVTEYKEYIDTRFEETAAEVGKNVQSVEDKVKVLEQSINSTGDDVGELAGDIERLILDNDGFKADIAETNKKIKDTQARITQLEQKVYQITQGRSQFVTAIEALEAAHAAHVARPPSPSVSPTLPQIDFIVQSIQDPLLEAARSAIKPMLSSMRDNIQALLQERNTEMYQMLWKRLSLTLKLVETLSARLTPHTDGVRPGAT